MYFPLRPASGRPDEPVLLVELDQTSPRYEPALWNMIDPPGPREGLPSALSDWEAGELRRAGIRLAPHMIVLKRQQLDGRSPCPDPLDDTIYGMFGFVASFVGSVLWWAFKRRDTLRTMAGSRSF